MEKILIIKHGALGDWILSTGVFEAIREHHPKAYIVFLTGSAYVSLAKQSQYFDDIWIDNREGIFPTLKLLYQIRKAKFTHIYDIQRSGRTHAYYQSSRRRNLFWSGKIASSKGYFIDNPKKHIVERMALQLQAAGINKFPNPDISWLGADISVFKLTSPYVLLIPGCAKHRPNKRWTASGYAELIKYLNQHGIQAVLIGTEADREIIEAILNEDKDMAVINLMNKTSFAELTELARHAQLIIGSDTGSMHIASSTGTDSLTLFCLQESNPKLNRPWGEHAKTLEAYDLKDLSASQLIETIEQLILID